MTSKHWRLSPVNGTVDPTHATAPREVKQPGADEKDSRRPLRFMCSRRITTTARARKSTIPTSRSAHKAGRASLHSRRYAGRRSSYAEARLLGGGPGVAGHQD